MNKGTDIGDEIVTIRAMLGFRLNVLRDKAKNIAAEIEALDAIERGMETVAALYGKLEAK